MALPPAQYRERRGLGALGKQRSGQVNNNKLRISMDFAGKGLLRQAVRNFFKDMQLSTF